MLSDILLTMIAACAVAEVFGYWLHVLMHSDKIEFLSRNHMIHHLVNYPPNGPQRSEDYRVSTGERASVLGLGMEWILPIALLLAVLLAAFRLMGVRPLHQAVFVAASLAWSGAMFWYMHDAMHLKGFWMESHALFRGWFQRARKRHDIHHMDLDGSGRMSSNYGICFFFFDRLFGTLVAEHRRFNPEGLDRARKRYAYIFKAASTRAPA